VRRLDATGVKSCNGRSDSRPPIGISLAVRPKVYSLSVIRVLVAEDQPLVRGGVVMLLQGHEDLEVVGVAEDGRTAIEAASRLLPDVVLMDIRMPGMDGIEATRALTHEPPTGSGDRIVRVLALSTFGDEESVYGVLRAGASGFVLKDSAPRDLLAAVRALASGDSWLDPLVAPHLLRALQHVPQAVAWSPALVAQLSVREREVLSLIAHGMSNAEIGERFVISEATVKTHVHRILMKTGCRDRAQAVVLAYRSGLVNPG
jgi:DNA-binding NarL/FixJ family response regulator